MSENTAPNRSAANDEIDLIDLFRRMGKTISRWLAALGRAILISIVFLVRRWLPLGISIVIGIALSFYLLKTSESFYTSDLVLRVNTGPTSEIMNQINRLHTYLIEENGLLESSMSYTPDISDNIIDIRAYWIIDNNNDKIPDFVDYEEEHNIYDSVNVRMTDRINVNVRIKSPQLLNQVRDGLIAYINSDPLFRQRNDLRINQNNELLARLQYDIQQLDSLQKVKYFEEARNLLPKNGGQMVFLQEQKTQLLYSDIYNLYSRKQSIERENTLYKDVVTILSDFSVPVERYNGLFYFAKFFIPAFFLLTLLVLILVANRRKIKEVFEKY